MTDSVCISTAATATADEDDDIYGKVQEDGTIYCTFVHSQLLSRRITVSTHRKQACYIHYVHQYFIAGCISPFASVTTQR